MGVHNLSYVKDLMLQHKENEVLNNYIFYIGCSFQGI